MKLADANAFRPLKPEMRWWLYFDSFLVLGAGIQLFVLTEQTDRYFAWTINPPVTAAFLGASYLGGLVLVFLSARERLWANARPAVPGVWLFTTLTLIATLIHLDRFHTDSAFGWIWLVIYVGVPPLLLWLFLRQQFMLKMPDPPRLYPLPYWLRISLSVQAAIMIVLGAVVFVAPQAASSIWPWTLTPLTGRAVAAWLIGVGCVAVNCIWEGDLRRVRVAMMACSALGILQFVVLARYANALDWSMPRPWVYLVFLLWFTLTALLGLRACVRVAALSSQTELSPA